MLPRYFADWNHSTTALIGLAWLTQSVELMGKLLGVVALVVGIYCSIAREVRESRARGRSGPGARP
jgi:hypothetical protein